MGLFDKLKSLLVSDAELIGLKPTITNDTAFAVPEEITCENVLSALKKYGITEGYVSDENRQNSSEALLASVKNQVVKMHEEILSYYRRKNLMPDDKLLNRLTTENMFYLAMGTAILAKVKMTNLITQGYFAKMLKKSGPDLFYREVARMAGNKYGDEKVEALHKHVQRAVYLLLTSFDEKPNSRELVVECAKAMYMYGLSVTIKK